LYTVTKWIVWGQEMTVTSDSFTFFEGMLFIFPNFSGDTTAKR